MPSKLPSPTADPDELAGVRAPGAAGAAGAAGPADGLESVLEGRGGGGETAGGSEDEYDRDDSFLADSGALHWRCWELGRVWAGWRAGSHGWASCD